MPIDAVKPPDSVLASVGSLTAFSKASKLCLSQINQVLVYDIPAMTHLWSLVLYISLSSLALDVVDNFLVQI